MPPAYESESFWNTRFMHETHFEWLGDGKDTILPVVRRHLQTLQAQDSTHAYEHGIPRTLHIGAGTSTLSDKILKAYREVYGLNRDLVGVVVNTDFAAQAVENGRGRMDDGGDGGVRWVRVDLMKWESCRALRDEHIDGGEAREDGKQFDKGLFEVVVDKSTSDAISCGEDLDVVLALDGMPVLTGSGLEATPYVHPFLSRAHLEDANTTTPDAVSVRMDPLEVLAVHLAALVRPGGVWVALSYSDHRFGCLKRRERGRDTHDRGVWRLWEVESVESVDTTKDSDSEEEGRRRRAYAPVIQHHLYILRRTDVSVES